MMTKFYARSLWLANHIHNLTKPLLAPAGLVLMVLAGITMIHFNRTLTSVDSTVATINGQLKNLDDTIKWLNVDTDTLHSVLIHIDLAANDSRKATALELSTLKSVNDQVSKILGHTDEAVQALTKNQNDLTQRADAAIDATTKTVTGLQPAELALKTTILSLNESAQQLTTTEKTLNVYLPPILSDAKDIGDSGKEMSADAAHAFHNYVYPKPIVSIVNWTIKLSGSIKDFLFF